MSKYSEDEEFLKYIKKEKPECSCFQMKTIGKKMDYIIELLEQLYEKK